MRVLMERDYSCDKKHSLYNLPYGVIADKKRVKKIFIDRNEVPNNVYDIAFEKTAILFKYNLDKSVDVYAEVE